MPAETVLREMMLAALRGDAAAYRRLLGELAPYLRHWFGRRLTGAYAAYVEDLVQETLLAVHTRRLTYDPDRPFTAWLHAIAHHKYVDHVRRHARQATIHLEDEAPYPARDHSGDAADRLDVEAALGALPQRTGALIRATRLEGATIAEAAARHGITETAAKVTIHRGLKSMIARFAGGTR